jgi:hypothetical protein
MMLPNTLVIKASRSLFKANEDFLVFVTGFSPKLLTSSNRYMEWVLPAGRYEVAVEQQSHRVSTQFWLSFGKRTEMVVVSRRRYQFWLGLSSGVFLVCVAAGLWSFFSGGFGWPLTTACTASGLAALVCYRQYKRSSPFVVKFTSGRHSRGGPVLPFL